MQNFIFLIFISFFGFPQAQNQYFSSSTGTVSFFSKTPVEDISATQSSASSVLNTGTKQLAVQINIKQFKFPNALMQEHFNENYMESEKYPTATFSGKINEQIDFAKQGKYQVTAIGKLKIHGIEQERTLSGTLEVGQNKLILDSDFEVALEDHKIEIPKVVFVKIAQKIQVKLHCEYLPK